MAENTRKPVLAIWDAHLVAGVAASIKLYCVFSPPIKQGAYKDIWHK